MHARFRFIFALGVAFGLAVASTDAMAGPRPAGELALFLRLNGVRQRYALADAGMSGLYGSAATCMPVTDNDVLVIECSATTHICDASTDAGCSTTATDINYGSKLAADTPRYIVVDTSVSSTLCMVPASGSSNCPVWRMR